MSKENPKAGDIFMMGKNAGSICLLIPGNRNIVIFPTGRSIPGSFGHDRFVGEIYLGNIQDELCELARELIENAKGTS